MTSPLHLNTPLVESDELSKIAGVRVLLKMDALQTSGSFKIRGISHRCIKAMEEQNCNHFVCSSGGNAGMAAAYSGKKLGVKVTVVVPISTPEFMVEKIRSQGANVELYGKVWDDADQLARSLVEADKNAAYIHPFDHPDIWQGHSTIITEIEETLKERKKIIGHKHNLLSEKPKAVITVVGGGGLLAGALIGLKKVGWEDVPVIALETDGAASFAEAMKKGEPVTLSDITTIARTLGAKTVSKGVFEMCHSSDGTSTGYSKVIPHLVTDKMAVEACLRFADDQRCLVEPACGAALSAIYHQVEPLKEILKGADEEKDYVVVIVCGGNMVSLKALEGWKKTFEI